MHVVPLSSPRLPRVSDVPPSVALDAVARNLRPVYASLLDQSVPEHLATLSRRQYATVRKPLSDQRQVWKALVATTPVPRVVTREMVTAEVHRLRSEHAASDFELDFETIANLRTVGKSHPVVPHIFPVRLTVEFVYIRTDCVYKFLG